MERSRLIAAAFAVGGLIGLGFSTGLMVKRVRAFHEANPRTVYAFQPVDSRTFTFAGRDVSLVDDKANPDGPKLLVTYGGDSLLLDVAIPGRYELPGLKSHEDWMKVLRFLPRTGLDEAQFAAALNSGKDRLAIVTRTPPKGVDPASWGSVWKTAWVFDFYELMPQGGFFHKTLNYPTKTHGRSMEKPKEGELQENTWEFQAALQLMPQAGQVGPTHNFYGDALAAAGIALPGAAFSGLAAALGVAFVFAPRRRTE